MQKVHMIFFEIYKVAMKRPSRLVVVFIFSIDSVITASEIKGMEYHSKEWSLNIMRHFFAFTTLTVSRGLRLHEL